MESNTYSARRRTSLRRLLDGLDGHWPAELAAVDARGAAGADLGAQAPSTAGRLRNRLHLSHDTASGWVRTAQALTDGAVSRAHGAVVAAGAHDPPPSPRSTRSRCWWRRLGGWTHPGCAGSLATSSRPPTPKPPRPTWSASTSGGACG
jgi:hypothetical protein